MLIFIEHMVCTVKCTTDTVVKDGWFKLLRSRAKVRPDFGRGADGDDITDAGSNVTMPDIIGGAVEQSNDLFLMDTTVLPGVAPVVVTAVTTVPPGFTSATGFLRVSIPVFLPL